MSDTPFVKDRVHFATGKQYWKLRKNSPSRLRFETPEDLIEACQGYFDWAVANPLEKHKVFGSGYAAFEQNIRPFTVSEMCIHIGIRTKTWGDYRKREAFEEVCEWADQVCYNQKYALAATGLGNGNIIARELGLADRTLHGNDPQNPLTPAKITRKIVDPKE